MESIVRHIQDISDQDRHALERVVGHSLSVDQQLVIQVVGPNAARTTQEKSDMPPLPMLPSWCNVYEGLSDQEISEIEVVALPRAQLGRPAE